MNYGKAGTVKLSLNQSGDSALYSAHIYQATETSGCWRDSAESNEYLFEDTHAFHGFTWHAHTHTKIQVYIHTLQIYSIHPNITLTHTHKCTHTLYHQSHILSPLSHAEVNQSVSPPLVCTVVYLVGFLTLLKGTVSVCVFQFEKHGSNFWNSGFDSLDDQGKSKSHYMHCSISTKVLLFWRQTSWMNW